MNSSNHNPMPDRAESGGFEDTLRLIAKLPAPEGLEVRVIAGLRASRLGGSHNLGPRGARILSWPGALRPGSDWMRGAAAAAIVFVVVGGGWGVYSRVQRPQAAKVIAMPARGAVQGGFSNAGAMRTPTTLNRPVVATPVTAKAAQANVVPQAAKKPNRHAMAGGTHKGAPQPIARAK